MGSYFDSPAIGSSILGQVIEEVRRDKDGILRPSFCFDRATVPIKPTVFMETGKQFEDLVEQEYTGKPVFDEKYFISNLASFPSEIIDILEISDIETAVDNAYVYKADGTLHGTYKRKHHCLDQIKAHDYRRPVPDADWEKLQIMLKRFGDYPFTPVVKTDSLKSWMSGGAIVKMFQVEHFWKHESGADCRQKLDMIWKWKVEGDWYAIPFDLKATANFPSFKSSWKHKYIWQSKHYIEGFLDYCSKNDLRTDAAGIPLVWYVVQESVDPYITHCWALSKFDLDELTPAYDEAIEKTWDWIQAGKPVAGHTKQKEVDLWGREKQGE